MSLRLRDALVVGSGFLFCWALATAVLAQEGDEPAVPADSAGDQATGDDEPAIPPQQAPGEDEGFYNGLYIAVGYGEGTSEDINASLLLDSTRYSQSRFAVEEQQVGIAKIGWKLPEDRGAFRLVFNGYEEQEYEFDSVGAQAALQFGTINPSCDITTLREAVASGAISPDQLDASPGYVTSPLGGQCLYGWWDVAIRNGQLLAERTPGSGDPNADVASGGSSPGDVLFRDPDRRIEAPAPGNLQNAVVTWDALYGRDFGGRRFSSRWWGGVRYFEYEGQVLQTSWLNSNPNATPGAYFTDQSFLRLLNIGQEASGWGPVGSWEMNFNFFDKGLAFYLLGEAAFTFNSIDMDSGTFFGIVEATDRTVLAPMRLKENRDKSSWQTSGEIGVRVRMRKGFEFELAYQRRGFLDLVLLPSSITIPMITGQISINDPEDSVSALYSTQDIEIDSVHGLVGFQF